MQNYQEVEGDLIELAFRGEFDVIGHGVNCQNTQKSGLAAQMAKQFNTDNYSLELPHQKGNINKLGQIDGFPKKILNGQTVMVLNCYTQFDYGRDFNKVYLNYDALRLCLQKINHIFKGKHIGLPQIGCGLGKGSWHKVKKIIQSNLKDCKVTVVIYNKQK